MERGFLRILRFAQGFGAAVAAPQVLPSSPEDFAKQAAQFSPLSGLIFFANFLVIASSCPGIVGKI
jgi:hypothetical protein